LWAKALSQRSSAGDAPVGRTKNDKKSAMSVIDFTEIPKANTGSGDQDTFEMFARDFFWSLGFDIEIGPSRGADGGRDLLVFEPMSGIVSQSGKRWLVSCKHFAHSGRSVADKHEPDIAGRVSKFSCDGFIAFYSTLPSSGLANTIELLKEKFLIEVFDKARIEHFLVSERKLRSVLRRFLPNSYKDVLQNYTWEKFYLAVTSLVSGDKNIKERVTDAYIHSLMHLREDDIPISMKRDFEELEQTLTSIEPIGDEGRVRATLREMGIDEAREIAIKIFSMYDNYRVNMIDDL